MNLLLIFPDMVPHMKYARFRDLQQRNENTNKQTVFFYLSCFKVAFGCNAWVTVDSFGVMTLTDVLVCTLVQ